MKIKEFLSVVGSMAVAIALTISCNPVTPTPAPEPEPDHVHKLEIVKGQAPTEYVAGWKDFYKCVETENPCGKLFEDSEAKVEITDLDAWKSEGGNGYLPKLAPGPEPGAPAAYGALPTEGQVAWQRQEATMFFHFGPATFSGYDGDRADYSASQLINHFKPTAIDCDQWAKTASECGFKGVILTVKHHDGFCIWPNPASECSVSQCSSPYNVDVLKKLSDACKKYGLNLGIYMSPWDKVTTGDYANKYLTAIESVLGGTYGTVNEFWLDGHNAGKAGINFNTVNSKILSYNPNTVIFSNVGPGCRWVGNEDGNAGETNWSTFSPDSHGASQSSLPGNYENYLWSGDQGGKYWIPAETDMSIRPIGDNNGWFWGASETPKTAKQLMKIFYESTGRNSIMLCNVPPTKDGVLDSKDVTVLQDFWKMRSAIFGKNLAEGATVSAEAMAATNVRGSKYGPENMLDGNYDTYFATKDDKKTSVIEFTLKEKATFNRVVLQEYIPLGQRVKSFVLKYRDASGAWKTFSKGGNGTTIGCKRIMMTNSVTTDAVRLEITGSLACPVLNGFGLYNDTVSGL